MTMDFNEFLDKLKPEEIKGVGVPREDNLVFLGRIRRRLLFVLKDPSKENLSSVGAYLKLLVSKLECSKFQKEANLLKGRELEELRELGEVVKPIFPPDSFFEKEAKNLHNEKQISNYLT